MRTIVDSEGNATIAPPSESGDSPTATAETPGCSHSPICRNRLGRPSQSLQRVQWEQTLGYAFSYPYRLPTGPGGVPAVALDSNDNLWVFQRAEAGKPRLFKFDPDFNLILKVGPAVIGYQDKAHGMAVDADDNVWITATHGATVMKLSPEGELLLTIGESGRRGDWNETEGQRLLWEPVMVAFSPNGDVYIGQGHGTRAPTIPIPVIRPTTSARRGSCTSTRTASSSTSGMATRPDPGSSTRPMGWPSIPRTAMSGSATVRTIASSSIPVTASFSRRCK